MRKIVCCAAAILLLAGCIRSLHPPYTEKDVFFDPALRMSAMSHSWLDELLKKNPGAIAQERRGNEIVFTAGTREMQAFVLKHLSTPEAFGKPTEMERR